MGYMAGQIQKSLTLRPLMIYQRPIWQYIVHSSYRGHKPASTNP